MKVMLFSLLLNIITLPVNAQIDLDFQNRISDGESRYKSMISKSYGSCWTNALTDLRAGCQHLTEETQSRLSLAFSNCFLEYSGKETCACSSNVPIKSCLAQCSDLVFTTFTEFFTHTQSVCHYLQHRQWQENTERTVHLLTESSKKVSQQMDEASQSQSKILDMQQKAILEQRKIISNGRTLNIEIEKSRSDAKTVFDEFKTSTQEQRLMIFEVFDRIKNLQGLVLGEFTGVYTCVYYLAAVLIVYVMSSVPRTADSRVWLLLLISACAVCERILAAYGLEEELLNPTLLDSNGPIYSRIWICRKMSCSVGFVILLYFYYTYRDYNRINNELLREIQQQNVELKEFIKSVRAGEFTSTPKLSNGFPKHVEKKTEIQMATSPQVDAVLDMTDDSKLPSESTTPKPASKVGRKKGSSSVQRILSSSSRNTSLLSPENIIENVSPKRYNLRSRLNSPAQSPNYTEAPLMHKDFVDTINMHLQNKSILLNRI